jgi:phosphatidylserine decarboxylase
MLVMFPESTALNIPVVGFLFSPTFWLAFWLFATAFLVIFFRDPERHGPEEGMLSPADGRVMPDRGDDTLRIFMNVHNVHVNRTPLAGRVTGVEHKPGGLRPAFTKDSDLNERTHIQMDTEHGEIVITQIAGTVARRIVTYVQSGEKLARGQRIGLIRLGSRVDVTIPEGFRVTVEKGQAVKAGLTVIAVQDDAGSTRRRETGKTKAAAADGTPTDAPSGRASRRKREPEGPPEEENGREVREDREVRVSGEADRRGGGRGRRKKSRARMIRKVK